MKSLLTLTVATFVISSAHAATTGTCKVIAGGQTNEVTKLFEVTGNQSFSQGLPQLKDYSCFTSMKLSKDGHLMYSLTLSQDDSSTGKLVDISKSEGTVGFYKPFSIVSTQGSDKSGQPVTCLCDVIEN